MVCHIFSSSFPPLFLFQHLCLYHVLVSLWKRQIFLDQYFAGDEGRGGARRYLGEQDCFLVHGYFVHRTMAVTSFSFCPVSRDLQPWASPSSGPSPTLPHQHTASCEDGRTVVFSVSPALLFPHSVGGRSTARPHTLFPLFLIRNLFFFFFPQRVPATGWLCHLHLRRAATGVFRWCFLTPRLIFPAFGSPLPFFFFFFFLQPFPYTLWFGLQMCSSFAEDRICIPVSLSLLFGVILDMKRSNSTLLS